MNESENSNALWAPKQQEELEQELGLLKPQQGFDGYVASDRAHEPSG